MVTIGHIGGGFIYNIIPETVHMKGTGRWFSPKVGDLLESGVRRIAKGIAESFGAKAEVTFERAYPPTVNDADAMALARRAAESVAGGARVEHLRTPLDGRRGFRIHAGEEAGRLHHARRRPHQ